MKKILLGFIAIGLLTFVGCEKDDDTETATTVSTETASDDGTTGTDTSSDEGTDTSSDEGSTDTSDDITDSTDTSSDEAKDADGYTYKTVIIGEQEWFAENLKTSKYNDGTPIPNVTGDTEWEELETGAWCHYDNNSDYESTYGKLYNFHAIETGKLCPTGWHVPTDAEWTVLTDYLAANGHSGAEGTALKATLGWDDFLVGSPNGTDDYGWNGLPGGVRLKNGDFGLVGLNGLWWSSSQRDSSFWFDSSDSGYFVGVWTRYLLSDSDLLDRQFNFKELGHSVRCLRD